MNIDDLDIVLKSLNEVKERPSSTYQDIFDLLGENKFTDKELDLILDKLVKDRYVNKKPTFTKDKNGNKIEHPTIKLFHITYDGHLFLDNGGYKKKLRLDKIDNRRKIIVDYALIIGGGGAVIAACLSLYEIIQNNLC